MYRHLVLMMQVSIVVQSVVLHCILSAYCCFSVAVVIYKH